MEANVGRLHAAIEDMTAARPVLADEVEMPAGHLDSLGVLGEPEAEHRPVETGELEDALAGDNLGQRPIGRFLARDRSPPDALESPVDPHSAGGRVGGDPPIDFGEQAIVVDRALEAEVEIGLEGDDDCERRPLLGRNLADPTLDVSPVEVAGDGGPLPLPGGERFPAPGTLPSQP